MPSFIDRILSPLEQRIERKFDLKIAKLQTDVNQHLAAQLSALERGLKNQGNVAGVIGGSIVNEYRTSGRINPIRVAEQASTALFSALTGLNVKK